MELIIAMIRVWCDWEWANILLEFTTISQLELDRAEATRVDSLSLFFTFFRRLEKDWELKELKILNKVTY